jgi:hypothetical protein
VALVLVLAGAVWSLLLWAPASASLAAGTSRFAPETAAVTVPGYGPRGTHVVDYRHGAPVEVVVPLRNDGPLPLRVTSVTAAGREVLPLLRLDGADLPVTVPAGGTAEVVLRGVLGNCAYYHERQVQNVDGVQVEAQVLGRSTTRQVPLDRPLLVHSPMIVSCPDRTLTRNDDRRTPSGSRL